MDREIYYDVDAERLILSDGSASPTPPHLVYGDKPNWNHNIKRVSASGTVSAVDMSDATSWEYAVAGDLSSATAPWIRVLNANIDSSAAATGGVSVLIDSEQSAFLTAIDGLYRQDAYARLKGTSATNTYIIMYQIKASADNDPNGGTPGENPSNYYTKSESDVRFEQITSGTQATLTDDATTDITVFDKTAARGAVVEYVIVGAAGMRIGRLTVGFFGASAYINDSYIEVGSSITGISYAADISGNNVRANVTLAAVGENLKIVYRISQITLET